MRYMHRSPFRGALYHLGLIFVVGVSFNWGFLKLTGVDLVNRLFAGVVLPPVIMPLVICVSAIIVLWSNWAD